MTEQRPSACKYSPQPLQEANQETSGPVAELQVEKHGNGSSPASLGGEAVDRLVQWAQDCMVDRAEGSGVVRLELLEASQGVDAGAIVAQMCCCCASRGCRWGCLAHKACSVEVEEEAPVSIIVCLT